MIMLCILSIVLIDLRENLIVNRIVKRIHSLQYFVVHFERFAVIFVESYDHFNCRVRSPFFCGQSPLARNVAMILEGHCRSCTIVSIHGLPLVIYGYKVPFSTNIIIGLSF